MADRERTGPTASNVSPTKDVTATSPPKDQDTTAHDQSQEAEHTASVSTADIPPEDNGIVEAEDDGDSAIGSGNNSGTTSIASSIYAGYIENGRRYQITREGEYWGPNDEKQWESEAGAHVMHLILDSQQKNNLFRAPVSDSIHNILDIGTGNGAWAQDVADKFPSAVIEGIDLYPPPETWVPPNCIFTVEDANKPWQFEQKFDLIHLRWLFGSFTGRQWDNLYDQAYKNLVPGGWIEQVEPDINFLSDDGTLPADSLLASWGPMFIDICARAGKPLDTAATFKSRIQHHGFVNVQEKVYKVPFGNWAKNKLLKEAGRVNKEQQMAGMEGYAMFLLTHFGLPKPWTPEEVQVFLAKVRKEMGTPGLHAYQYLRRAWAQKPYDTEKKVEVEAAT